MKTDWMGSSFSTDGHFLLAIDDSRALIVDAAAGRELRGVQLAQGEVAVWSRPIPASEPNYRWVVSTDRGRLLEVDGRTGKAIVINTFPPTAPHIRYTGDELAFEFATPSALVVSINQRIERKEATSTRSIEGRKLLWQPLGVGATSGTREVPMDLYFTHLASFLSVNADSKLAALASRDGTRVVVWRFDADAASTKRFGLVCVYDGNEKVRSIGPAGKGFAVVDTEGKMYLLDSRPSVAVKCTEKAPTELTQAPCKIEESVSLIAGKGKRVNELFAVTRDYTVIQLDLAAEGCAYTKSILGNVKNAFFSAPIYRPGDLKTSKDDPDWNAFVAAPMGDGVNMVAGASLTRFDRKASAPVIVQSLAGRPSGALELESGPGFILASRSMAALRVFDVAGGRLRTYEYDYRKYLDESFFYNRPYAIVRQLGAIAIIERDGQIRFHEALGSTDTSMLPPVQKLAVLEPNALCTGEDGRRVWVLSSKSVSVFEANASGTFVRLADLTLREDGDIYKIACSASGQSAIASDSLSDLVYVLKLDGSAVRLVQKLNVPGSAKEQARPSLSADSLVLAVGPYVFGRRDDSTLFGRPSKLSGVDRLVFNPDSSLALGIGARSRLYSVAADGGKVRLAAMAGNLGGAGGGAFLGGLIVLLRDAEYLEVRTPSGGEVGRFVFGDGGQWLFTDGKGRFDTYDPEGKASAYWVMNDDPMRALDPELFMRDYLEPRLLPRLMECRLEEARRPTACQEVFGPIRPVSALNRARPTVEFAGIDKQAGADDTVTVRLRVSGAQEVRLQPGVYMPRSSGAFDVHLRLNGQLVARRPRAKGVITPPEDREGTGWQDRSRVVSGTGTENISIPGIKLPHTSGATELVFSAYAFNEDRVKGPTRELKYPVPAKAAAKRRAFVVAIGSSAYEDKRLDLRFPAADARTLLETVVPALRSTRRFAEVDVMPISLTSEWEEASGQRRVLRAETTKDRIRQVLEAIGGTGRDPKVPAPSSPDDTVIILFSGHGLNHAQEFYLVPYDSGEKSPESGPDRPPLNLGKQISSAELAHWLRDLVAEEIVLVIDACHSSASVESADFKPGPMGARGLGQLAYDKGMRVLASTRPNDLAWESKEKGQGLLSYALLQEGLVLRKADRLPSNGEITFGEWLQYAVDRVPSLYGEAWKGLGASDARLLSFDSNDRRSREVTVDGMRVQAKSQQPSLFNYRRREDKVLSPARPKK